MNAVICGLCFHGDSRLNHFSCLKRSVSRDHLAHQKRVADEKKDQKIERERKRKENASIPEDNNRRHRHEKKEEEFG